MASMSELTGKSVEQSPLQSKHPDNYLHSPVPTDRYVRVRTVCKECGGEFVGDAWDVVRWEDRHYDACQEKLGAARN